MSSTTKDDAPEQPQAATGAKRPYDPPRIEETGSFERLVLGCVRNVGPCDGKGMITS
jgi:hypothetical protein